MHFKTWYNMLWQHSHCPLSMSLHTLKTLKPRLLLWPRKSVTGSRTWQFFDSCASCLLGAVLTLQTGISCQKKAIGVSLLAAGPLPWEKFNTQGHCHAAFLPMTVQRQPEVEVMKCTAPHSSNLTAMLNNADHDCSNTTAKIVLKQR